jgi:hypothetical protein
MNVTTIAAILSLIGVLILGIVDLVKSRNNAEFQGVSSEEKKQNMIQALIDRSLELNKQEFETMKQVNDELRKQLEDHNRTIEVQIMEIARLENTIVDLQEASEGKEKK